MAMPINQYAADFGDSTYYDRGFLVTIDSYRTYLKVHEDTQVISIEPALALKREFDFIGLCQDLNLPMKYMPIIMRVNGLQCAQDYTQDRLTLYIPSSGLIEKILQLYKMKKA